MAQQEYSPIIEGQEEDSHNLNGVAWQEAGRASCTVCQYSPPIGQASFHASANGSAPDAPRRSSSTEVDCSHTQYKGRENIYCLFIGLRIKIITHHTDFQVSRGIRLDDTYYAIDPR